MIIIVAPGYFPILANNRAFSPRLIDPQATQREDHRPLSQLTDGVSRRRAPAQAGRSWPQHMQNSPL